MEAALIITCFVCLTLLFLLVGGIIGWIYGQSTINSLSGYQDYMHPEMFDKHGNLLPDEILAVRFENDYDYEDDEDD
jgi:hypothetical protein